MKKRGQILLELIWLILFLSGFLASILYLFEKGRGEIEKYRLGKGRYHDTRLL